MQSFGHKPLLCHTSHDSVEIVNVVSDQPCTAREKYVIYLAAKHSESKYKKKALKALYENE